jgi:hypothetical protein
MWIWNEFIIQKKVIFDERKETDKWDSFYKYYI